MTSGVGSISFGGLASGLPSNMVDMLMQAEQTRMTSLQRQQASYSSEQTAVSDLKSKLMALSSKALTLEDPSYFRPHTATSSDTTVFTATATSDAQAASHSITVTTLAVNQSVASNGGPTSTTDTTTAAATICINYNGTQYTENIASGSTLADVASAINADTTLNPSSTTGVSASVLFDGTNYRLVLRAKDGGLNGAAQRIDLTTGATQSTTAAAAAGTTAQLTFAGGSSINFGSAPGGGATLLQQTAAGVNAALTVDGVAVSSTSNTVTTALPGVTLNLLGTGANKSLAVANDTTTLQNNLNDFMKTFNDLVSFVKTETATGGRLQKNSSLARGLLSQIRGQMQLPTNSATPTVSGGTTFNTLSPFSMIAEIGIRSNSADGTLTLDQTWFNTAVTKGFDTIASVFTANPSATDSTNFTTAGANKGLSYRLYTLVKSLTDSTGSPVSSQQDSLTSRLSSLQTQMDREQSRLDKVRAQLVKKFSSLEQMTSSLQGQGNQLTSALSSLKA
ncbi:MAG: flagellar filament capping protein FliD [Magnetococcales bacterium]|nr:flagellar filament capping protein FliD [Magnetococcales bacterium]